jgi:hypothetical protein
VTADKNSPQPAEKEFLFHCTTRQNKAQTGRFGVQSAVALQTKVKMD